MAGRSKENKLTGGLRKQAEKVARKEAPAVPQDLQSLSPQAAGKLLHELRVHQIELEEQNEELRAAQEKLEEARAQYFALYDLAPVGYFSISEQGIILEANLTGANLLDVAPPELRRQRFTRFILKDDQDVYYRGRRQLFETHAPQFFDMRMVCRGATFWARVDAVLAQDAKGRKPVCHLTVSDITAQKKADELLRLSEEKYRMVVENALEAIFIAVGGMIIFANRRTEIITGYAVEEITSRPFVEFIHPDDRDMVIGRHLGRMKGEDIPDIYSFRIIHKAGNIRWVELSAVMITWDGRPAVLNFLSDITDRNRLEEEQQRVDKLEAVGLLAGGIAHDFNNILTAILGNISLAGSEASPGSELSESLEQAEKASLRAKALTMQLLTFSKGGAPVKKITSLLQLISDTASFALSGSNVKCNFSLPGDLWHAEVDPGQVSQVIHNLVINAQQAMPTGGSIEIGAENLALSETQGLGRGLPVRSSFV
jgi:PAS domain S-box-containing protein